MYKFCNVHPKGLLVPDCVKRAITKTADMDYHEVQLQLNRHKKLTGAKTFNEDKNWKSFVENVLNGTKLNFPAVKGIPRMNGTRFCKAYPKGRYILNMAGHWTACVDGIIYDTWDCRDKCVYTAYKMRTQEEIDELNKALELDKELKEKAKRDKEIYKANVKKIKDKYAKKIKPLQKKIKDLEKLMAKEIELLNK